MTPNEFMRRYALAEQRERQGSQSHFIDLCALLGVQTPLEENPAGDWYCFERGATKTEGGDGWADVWRRGCFAWEYKGPRKNLDAALRQVVDYAAELENPPLLIVSDMVRIRVHTRFTNTVPQVHEWKLEDLFDAGRRRRLSQAWTDPESFRPSLTPADLTAAAARKFGALGRRLQERPGADPRAIAHFLNQIVFCMFAEDAGLLPKGLFTRTLRATQNRPAAARAQMADLFAKMATREEAGRFFGAELIAWFNGGLFDGAEPLELSAADLAAVADTAEENDWTDIDPAIFGTLFEQALKATRERPALGAHYTDREKILQIVRPVMVEPLEAEWAEALAGIKADAAEMRAAEDERRAIWDDAARAMAARGTSEGETQRRSAATQTIRRRDEALGRARARLDAFQQRLADFRVLDPACGSGNFLYVALHALKDLEQRALEAVQRLGVETAAPRVGLQCVRGIEIDRYAAELARVTLWIGDLQWDHRHGYTPNRSPVLSSLESIENRDALLDADGGEAAWPAADVIVGNPPFLGGKKLRAGLGDGYVERLFAAYRGRVPAEADLVAYWVARAWAAVGADPAHPLAGELSAAQPTTEGALASTPAHPLAGELSAAQPRTEGALAANAGADVDAASAPSTTGFAGGPPPARAGEETGGRPRALRAGLVTTNSIRGGANRRVVEPIAASGRLMEAWSDEPWAQDGAAVRVSMLGFGEGFVARRLNGAATGAINADLTGGGLDLTQAKRLRENAGVAFMGDTKGGAFDVPGEVARGWLTQPLNPNGRPNSDVLKPWRNGLDVTRRPTDKWIIDFGSTMSELEAALYDRPFTYAVIHVAPERRKLQARGYAQQWWRHERPRPELLRQLSAVTRYIITPRVATYRTFTWHSTGVCPDSATIAVARDDDTAFGILHSRFHELWALRMGTSLEDRPRYTPSTTFETFPFPDGLTPDIPAASYADDPRARAIAAAAAELDRLREAWLNPADLVRREPEVVAGYPDRILPVDEAAARELKTRTLTRLYNARPAWLAGAHRALDEAVAAAYGWTDWAGGDLPDDEVLARLFALNQARAAAGR